MNFPDFSLIRMAGVYVVVMSIGNQEIGIPRNFFVFSWYFIGILSTASLKFGLMLVFFGRIKIGLVFGFCGCHFIGIGLVSVCHFPESGISNT